MKFAISACLEEENTCDIAIILTMPITLVFLECPLVKAENNKF